MIAVIIVGAAAAGILLSAPHSTKSSTTSSTSGATSLSNSSATGGAFNISYDTLTVGYKGGLFQLGFQVTEGKEVQGLVAVLSTPVQAVMCSGGTGGGMGFSNCLPGGGSSYTFSAGPAGGFSANTTFTGYDSGAGPGSAVAGQTYSLSITATYADGTSSNETLTVQAVSG